MPLISIIMPVYNSEKYLEKAIESVLAQTMKDFELLLIDDGSKDRSGAICDEYVQKDPRIRVFHQENRGISGTRNRGIREAAGDFVMFMDNDDFLMEDAMEKVADALQDPRVDVVKFGYRVEESFATGKVEKRDRAAEQKIALEQSNIDQYFIETRESGYFFMIWNGAYRRARMLEDNLFFDERIRAGYEDWTFNYGLYAKNVHQVLLPYIGYIHYQREEHSTSKKYSPNQIEALILAANAEKKMYEDMYACTGTRRNWEQKSVEYLIEICTVFQRRGCDLSHREKAEQLDRVYDAAAFADIGLVLKQPVSKVRRLVVQLFTKKQYRLLLALSGYYYHKVILKKKNYSN